MSYELRKSRLGEVVTIRYRDASGRQIRETLGLKSEGWTRKKALEHERLRIVESRNVGVRKPIPTLVALGWLWYDETSILKAWKPRTLRAYDRAIARLEDLHEKPV